MENFFWKNNFFSYRPIIKNLGKILETTIFFLSALETKNFKGILNIKGGESPASLTSVHPHLVIL